MREAITKADPPQNPTAPSPGSKHAPAKATGERVSWILGLLTRIDRAVRRVPAIAQRFPGIVAVGALALVMVGIWYDQVDLGMVVPALAALVGVWIGQSLSARQAREAAARTEDRLLAERRSSFQTRTLTEVTEELKRLCDATEAVLKTDYAIRDGKDSSEREALYRRRNDLQLAYFDVASRVRVLRERVADPVIAAAIVEVGKNCRETVQTTPLDRLDARKYGDAGPDLWDAPNRFWPAYETAIALIGKALQNIGG